MMPGGFINGGIPLISLNFSDTLYSHILLNNTLSRLVYPDVAKEIINTAVNTDDFFSFRVVSMFL